jgi:hypothetical protein
MQKYIRESGSAREEFSGALSKNDPKCGKKASNTRDFRVKFERLYGEGKIIDACPIIRKNLKCAVQHSDVLLSMIKTE